MWNKNVPAGSIGTESSSFHQHHVAEKEQLVALEMMAQYGHPKRERIFALLRASNKTSTLQLASG
jgi:hypothetical protein